MSVCSCSLFFNITNVSGRSCAFLTNIGLSNTFIYCLVWSCFGMNSSNVL